MVNIILGATQKPVSSEQLANIFRKKLSEYSGELYIGYPIIAAPEGPFPIDALWISKDHGLIIFNIVEGALKENYDETQDESANRLETKLRAHLPLMSGRKLLAEPSVITFAPGTSIYGKEKEGYRLANVENMHEKISEIEWKHPEKFEEVLSIIQSISSIRKGKRSRIIKEENSRGAILKRLEGSIANLDNIQGRAVIETVEGVQRIRGLAGSGKTIILALKAAYLHTQHPDWRIAVTFNTRSLKSQFRRLINMFVIEQSGEEPDWTKILILNAWGASGDSERTGIYFQFTRLHDLEYVDFQSARQKYGYEGAFAGACKAAISRVSIDADLYDVILVDEAQDFDPAFLQICYSLLSSKKRLIYAYDELQSLTDASLPSPEEMFGKKPDGSPKVRFAPQQPGQPSQDIILEKCYRNSRPVLATAHALGFGVYRVPDAKTGTGLIQMFERSNLWLDVGYRVVDGELEDGKRVHLARTSETSPLFLEQHSPIEDIIQFKMFDTKEAQANWLAGEIQNNIENEELEPDDIIVINPDPPKTRSEVGLPRRLLFDLGIETHLVGVDRSPDEFFDMRNASVAFTGIHRAKGNEAGMVYIMNADHCAQSYGNLARVRNQLFTAITRSKSWVRVLGVGNWMQELILEFQKVVAANFELDFVYPDAETRKTMNIINRDMTETEKQATRSSSKKIASLLNDVDSGRVRIDDLPEEDLERLRRLLLSKDPR